MSPPSPSAERNRALYGRVAESYIGWELSPPEQVFLRLLRGRWHEIRMLDIGVGTGRTSYTFSAIAREYVGIDYAPEMIELSRQQIGETDAVRFLVCDARDMAIFDDGAFDVVLFSFNGIDSVDERDRGLILHEVKRLLAPEGLFYFSSHSLSALPFAYGVPPLSLRDPVRSAYRLLKAVRQNALRLRLNRTLELEPLRERGRGLVRDEAHGGQLLQFYATPGYQMRELEQAGFRVKGVYDLEGRPVESIEHARDHWLHYLCELAQNPGTEGPTLRP